MSIKENLEEIGIIWFFVTTTFLFISMIVLFYESLIYGTFGDYKMTEFLIGEAIYWDKPWWYTWIRTIVIPTVITIVLVIIGMLFKNE